MAMRVAACCVVAGLLVGCGKEPVAGGGAPAAASTGTAAGVGTAPAAQAGPAPAPAATAAAGGSELVNPDEATMVFLFHDLAGLPAPIDSWVEEDSSVKYAPAPDKAARRAALRARLQAGAAAVHGTGRLRLTVNANMSDYDPVYGEFTLRALAPSSMVEFKSFGQTVAVKFANGRTAQIWKVPAEQAQAVRDRIGHASNVDMDVLLGIVGVQPGPNGGTINTQVLEYELRDSRSGATLGRVQATP